MRVAFLACAAVVSLIGFGRFAYGLYVPALGEHLGYDLGMLGALGTANLAGYAIGAIVAAPIAGRIGQRRAIVLALAVGGLSVAATSISTMLGILALNRFVAGICAGIGWVLLASLIMQDVRARRSGTMAGIAMSGTGLGIAMSGLILPPLIAMSGGWRWSWLVAGAPSLVTALAIWRWGPESPARRTSVRNPVGRGLPAAYAICLLYGIGYSTAATFLVQLLHDKPGFGARGPAAIWTLVGIGAIVGPIVLGRCADRFGGRLVLITAIVTLASSILAFLPHWPIAAAALVALVFGGSFIGVGMAVLLFTRERVDEADAPSALGYATSFTSLGQMLGPAVLGWIASHWGLANAFLVAAMSVGAAAIVLCVPQRADEGASREAGGR